MPQNRKSSQVCLNLNRFEVLLPFSSVEPENACEIVKQFTGIIILPEDFQAKTQRGLDKFDCRDGSILSVYFNGSQRYCFTFIPYGFLEPPN
ncbi:hypothetical protein NIES2111_18870 [Nostoc sp. NIES-2111]|nr:hypothetical protein NIES2111_18870 [Nostoc sp. NIES-2111]